MHADPETHVLPHNRHPCSLGEPVQPAELGCLLVREPPGSWQLPASHWSHCLDLPADMSVSHEAGERSVHDILRHDLFCQA